MQASEVAIVLRSDRFSHADACEIEGMIRSSLARTIVIDLQHVAESTTSAFARLVVLRRALIKAGRDLRLINLRSRAAGLYEINRLWNVLPSGLVG